MEKRTVIIMGAGAIRAAAGKKPVAKRPPLDCDFFEIASKNSPKLYKSVADQIAGLVGTYSGEVLQSLEDTTTFLYLKALDSTHRSRAHRVFVNQLHLLGKVIGDTTNALPIGPRTTLYRLILKELSKLSSSEHLSIITFNYDLMIERTLDALQAHNAQDIFNFPGCYRLPSDTSVPKVNGKPEFVNYGTRHTGVSVLKLHGSLSWSSTHTSRLPTPSALFNPGRKLHILNSIEILMDLSWKQNKRRVYMMPIILPPVTGKRGLLHKELGSVWEAAARALANANKLIIFGYSCPPLDFEAKILLGEKVQPETTTDLTIVDPNSSISSRFVSLCGLNKCTAYTSAKALLDD